MDKSVAWVKMVDTDQAKVKDLTKGQDKNTCKDRVKALANNIMDPAWDLASGKDLSKGPLEDSRES